MNLLLADAPESEVVHGDWPAWCRSTTSPTGRRTSWRTTHSTSAPTGCASSRRRTYPTTGRADCGSTRRRHAVRRRSVHAHRRSAGDRPTTTSWSRHSSPRRSSTPRPSRLNLPPTLERLAELEPTTLALMHGSSFRGDGATQLRAARPPDTRHRCAGERRRLTTAASPPLLVGGRCSLLQLVDHRGVGERGGVAEVATLGDVAQQAAHDLAAAGLGQVGREVDRLRLGESRRSRWRRGCVARRRRPRPYLG